MTTRPDIKRSPDSTAKQRCYDAHNCRLRGTFGDGCETWAAEWVIVDGKASRTLFSDSDDNVHFIAAHRMPPRYE